MREERPLKKPITHGVVPNSASGAYLRSGEGGRSDLGGLSRVYLGGPAKGIV